MIAFVFLKMHVIKLELRGLKDLKGKHALTAYLSINRVIKLVVKRSIQFYNKPALGIKVTSYFQICSGFRNFHTQN